MNYACLLTGTVMEPLLVLLLTPVVFLLWQVKMCCETVQYSPSVSVGINFTCSDLSFPFTIWWAVNRLLLTWMLTYYIPWLQPMWFWYSCFVEREKGDISVLDITRIIQLKKRKPCKRTANKVSHSQQLYSRCGSYSQAEQFPLYNSLQVCVAKYELHRKTKAKHYCIVKNNKAAVDEKTDNNVFCGPCE